MEVIIVLLLITIGRVQGYYNITNSNSHHLNETTTNYVHQNNVSSSYERRFNRRQFDDVFQHYRSDTKRREPRFISFQTKDDNIEVEIDFAIPFLSIPVKRSLTGAMGTFQNVITNASILQSVMVK